MGKRIHYLSNTVIPTTKREKNIHVFNVFTQVGVKQLTDFLRTVTAASDLVDCTLVNCECSENKHAGQLRGYREADLRLCFSHMQNVGFLIMRLIFGRVAILVM